MTERSGIRSFEKLPSWDEKSPSWDAELPSWDEKWPSWDARDKSPITETLRSKKFRK